MTHDTLIEELVSHMRLESSGGYSQPVWKGICLFILYQANYAGLNPLGTLFHSLERVDVEAEG